MKRRGGGTRGGGSRDGPRGGPERIDEVLAPFLRKHGLEREVEGQRALERWAEVVGDEIARVTRPTGLARGVLYVEVRSSAWMSELNLVRHEILARLNAGEGGGRVERILFRLAEEPDDASSADPEDDPG